MAWVKYDMAVLLFTHFMYDVVIFLYCWRPLRGKVTFQQGEGGLRACKTCLGQALCFLRSWVDLKLFAVKAEYFYLTPLLWIPSNQLNQSLGQTAQLADNL